MAGLDPYIPLREAPWYKLGAEVSVESTSKRNLLCAHKSYSVDGNSTQQMGQSGESLPKHSVVLSQNAKADTTTKRLKTYYPSQLTSPVPIAILLKDQK